MTRTLLGAAILATALSAPTSPSGLASAEAKGGKPSADLAVTTTIFDVDANSLVADTQSDGGGAYVNGTASRSVLAANAYNNLKWGDWQFDTLQSTSRGVGHRFDASNAVVAGDPPYIVPAQPPYWGTQVLKTKLQVECTFVNKSMLTMTSGSTMTCGLLRHFIYNSTTEYGLQSAPSFTGHTETTDVQISCTAAAADGCTDWFIDPIGLDRSVARLVKHTSRPNAKTHVGDFYLRFRIRVTR